MSRTTHSFVLCKFGQIRTSRIVSVLTQPAYVCSQTPSQRLSHHRFDDIATGTHYLHIRLTDSRITSTSAEERTTLSNRRETCALGVGFAQSDE